MKCANGDEYNGDFKNDLKKGKGVIPFFLLCILHSVVLLENKFIIFFNLFVDYKWIDGESYEDIGKMVNLKEKK